MKAIIVDIDGTLAHKGDRSPFDWSRVHLDTVNEGVAEIVRMFFDKGFFVLIVSGRDEQCRTETTLWLMRNSIPFHDLFMREYKNNEKDSVIKRRIFDTYIRDNYDVGFVLDDRDQVVKMWREELGLMCLQVNYGNF